MKTKSQMFLLSVATACGLGIAALAQEASQDPSLSGGQTKSQSSQQSGQSGSSAATSAQPSSSSSSQQLQDGLVKHEGKVKFIKNGQVQSVEDEMKLSEGITVQPNGEVELKDGTKMTLQEGQMVTLDSQVTTIPPEAIKTLKQSSSESPSGASGESSSRPGAGGKGGGSTSAPATQE